MAGVTLKDLTKSFKNVTAVNNVNLEIKDKEFMVLVGPSGCGKTTALRMIAGLEEATGGEIYIGDKLVNGRLVHLTMRAIVIRELDNRDRRVWIADDKTAVFLSRLGHIHIATVRVAPILCNRRTGCTRLSLSGHLSRASHQDD